MRHRHSAVESNINMLEHHGLGRCMDKGIKGFRRYVGISVLSYKFTHTRKHTGAGRKGSGFKSRESKTKKGRIDDLFFTEKVKAVAELCQTHKKVPVLQNNNPGNRRALLDSKGAIQKVGNIDIFNAMYAEKRASSCRH